MSIAPTYDEMLLVIKGLNDKKSPGINRGIGQVLENGGETLHRELYQLIEIVRQSGIHCSSGSTIELFLSTRGGETVPLTVIIEGSPFFL